jgi:hypothetical protein
MNVDSLLPGQTGRVAKTSNSSRSLVRFLRAIFCNDREVRAPWRLLLYFGFFALITMLLDSAYSVLAHGADAPQTLEAAFSLVGLLAAALVLSRHENRPFRDYGLPLDEAFGKHFWQGWLVGFAEISLIVALLTLFRCYSFGHLTVDWRTLITGRLPLRFSLGRGPINWVALGALITPGLALKFLVDGLTVQFLVLGYLGRTLSGAIGFRSAAVVLSGAFAILFGLGHESTGRLDDLLALPVLFALMLFWSLALRRTGNLWFGVGMLASFQFAATVLYSVRNFGSWFSSNQHLSSATLNGPNWLTGGHMGVDSSVLRLLTLALGLLLLNKLYPKGPTADEANSDPRRIHQAAGRLNAEASGVHIDQSLEEPGPP